MNAKEIRTSIGADILVNMGKNDDLPMPNIRRLSKTMQEYFVMDGMEDILTEMGYTWRPSEDYWRGHMSDIQSYLRKRRQHYFEFVREQGEFKGIWKFVSKKEYKRTMRRNHADIGTRVVHHNERIDDGEQRWTLDLPHLADVPLLTE